MSRFKEELLRNRAEEGFGLVLEESISSNPQPEKCFCGGDLLPTVGMFGQELLMCQNCFSVVWEDDSPVLRDL